MFGKKYLQRSYENDSMTKFLWKYAAVTTAWNVAAIPVVLGAIYVIGEILDKREQDEPETDLENETDSQTEAP